MPEDDALERRLAAVERALDDAEPAETPDAETLGERVDALEEDAADLAAALQAVRGYVGGVKHVNDEVEQRADAALAKAEAVDRSINGPATGLAAERRADTGSDARPADAPARDHAGTSGAADTTTRRCPRCGGPSRERSSGPDCGERPTEGASAVDRGEPSGTTDRGQPSAGRSGVPDGGESAGGHARDRDPRQRTGDAVPGARVAEPHRGSAGLGERTVGAAEDDPAGLLARLREVL